MALGTDLVWPQVIQATVVDRDLAQQGHDYIYGVSDASVYIVFI